MCSVLLCYGMCSGFMFFFFFSSRRRHTRFDCDWSSDVCSSDLEEERRALLTTLLGAQWESSYYPYPEHPTSLPLDGPALGSLPPETKQAVRDIEGRAAERRQAYMDAVQKEAKQPDPVELAKLRQQTRAELGQVLNPEQLEEYLLRYSGSATALRSELHGINLTPDQFRALFRSEEHTSELQSQSNLVCRLLLEKKNTHH